MYTIENATPEQDGALALKFPYKIVSEKGTIAAWCKTESEATFHLSRLDQDAPARA